MWTLSWELQYTFPIILLNCVFRHERSDENSKYTNKKVTKLKSGRKAPEKGADDFCLVTLVCKCSCYEKVTIIYYINKDYRINAIDTYSRMSLQCR